MRELFIIFSLSFFIISCSPEKSIGISPGTGKDHPQPIEVNTDKKIRSGETFIAEVKNIGGRNITIHNPMLKSIEAFEDDHWRKVKILYCPCGANCEPPPREQILQPGSSHRLRWNLIESWCAETHEGRIPETIQINSKPGLYRIRISYSEVTGGKNLVWKEFKITN